MDAALPAPTVAIPAIPPRMLAGRALDASFALQGGALQYAEYPNGDVGVYSPAGQAWLVVPGELSSLQCASTMRVEKKHPTWAIVLGIIGLITTLIGGLFLLVTTTEQTPTYLVTAQTTDGRWVRFYTDVAVAPR